MTRVRTEAFAQPGFLRFWTASTVSAFGSYVTTIALQVFVVLTLHGSAADVGFLNASRWLPYLLFGLVIGALVDRYRRQPILVMADIGRGVLLSLIPLLWLVGWLTMPLLMGIMAVFGVLSLVGDAADQSFLPRLVSPPSPTRCSSCTSPRFLLGVTLAAAGLGGLLGSLLSTRVGLRWGAGRTIIAGNAMMPFAWATIALTPVAAAADSDWLGLLPLAVGQFFYGLALGIENANEMGYRQSVTPDALQGRMNTTIRSINRAMIVIGAPAGGLLADAIGYRPTLWIAIAGFVGVTLALAASPFRHARHGD